MNTIGLVVNSNKGEVSQPASKLVSWLTRQNIKVLLNEETAALIGRQGEGLPTRELAEKCGCIMVLGGDGTLLNCARQTAASGTPIFGVNFGRVGFLTEIDIPDLIEKIEALIAGHFTIEERIMLEATVLRDGLVVDKSICLNDAVVSKGATLRMVHMNIRVNSEMVSEVFADGMIIASPTGSTAYSLSAGGPIIAPEVQAILITPICPQSLTIRPMVISTDCEVEIEVLPGADDVMLTMDGQYGFSLKANDKILVTKASVKARFVKIKKTGFFKVLRAKLKEWHCGLN